MSTSGYCIRRATGPDTDAIVRHRVAMFRDMGILDERDAGTLAATSLTYFEDALPSGRSGYRNHPARNSVGWSFNGPVDPRTG